jgi:hypothetical protein
MPKDKAKAVGDGDEFCRKPRATYRPAGPLLHSLRAPSRQEIKLSSLTGFVRKQRAPIFRAVART